MRYQVIITCEHESGACNTVVLDVTRKTYTATRKTLIGVEFPVALDDIEFADAYVRALFTVETSDYLEGDVVAVEKVQLRKLATIEEHTFA